MAGARSLRFRSISILTIIIAEMYQSLRAMKPWPQRVTQNPSFHPHSQGLTLDHPQPGVAQEETKPQRR